MFRTLIVACVVAFGASAVHAQSDAITKRKDAMKEILAAARPTFGMLRGQAPYDAAVVKNALQVIEKNAKVIPTLFPEDSKTGDTKALPAIWERKAEFDGYAAAIGKLAAEAQTKITDEASFKAEYPKVLAGCDSCHKPFQRPQ